MSYILASKSPRRKELMKLLTDDFEIIPSDAEEIVGEYTIPDEVPVRLAGIKAESVAREHIGRIVIGCDTIVTIDNEILGKPKDENDAFDMLSMLSGKPHRVVTGVCLVFFDGKDIRKKEFSVSTDVTFYQLTDDEIWEYIKTGEPMDKAGAYGIQEKGGLFVEGICGDWNNVVGLPVARLKKELEAFE